MKRVACYLRVSTTEQTVENQRNDLRAYCKARGWDDVIEYSDTGVSGTRERRPGLDHLMSEVKSRRVDVVVVAAFDRPGRSVQGREHHAPRCTRRGGPDRGGDPRCGGGHGAHPADFRPADTTGRPPQAVTPCTEEAREWLASVATRADGES